MNELNPCPFCGRQPEVLKRPSSMNGFFCAISCFCGELSARAYQFATDKKSIDAAYEKAAKLWNRRAAPENKPLTLEQLREMDGEPVWIPMPDGSGYGDWAIVDIGEQTELLKAVGIEAAHDESDYEKTWLAYARKPEGSESNE